MLGRKKNPSPQEEHNFRASIKCYYEDQIRKKRLSNETQFLPRRISNEQELEHHLSQLELREIEQNTVNSVRSRLSANKTNTSSNGSVNISISPSNVQQQKTAIIKSPTTPTQSILKSPATVKETKSKVTFSQIQPKQQISPSNNTNNVQKAETNVQHLPNKAQISPFLINSQPSNQVLFTPQQKPIASVGAFNAVGTPVSPPQASPIAQPKPTNTVFPQFSTPLQQPPAFVQNVAPVQRKQAIQRPAERTSFESLNLSSSSSASNSSANTSSNSSASFSSGTTSNSSQLSSSFSPKSAPIGVATNITSKLPDNLPRKQATPVMSMKPPVTAPPSNLPSTSSTSSPKPIIATAAFKEEQPGPSRQRRPSKSETPETSKFSHWVRTHLAIYEENMHRLREFRSNHAILPICNRVRMAVQEVIDIHTSEDPNDIKSISAALIFFQDLFKTGAAKKGDQPLPLIKEGKLFMLMCICDRYLKRVVGQDSCIMFVATLFIVLMKNEPQFLRQVLSISNGPAEQSAQWLNEEQARFKLLIQICALTTTKTVDHMQGQELIRFLLTEATSHAPSIPIATPFVLNTILSIDMKNYRKHQPAEFANLVQKARSICDLNWSVVIRTSIGTSDSDISFTDRALTLMTTKNAALIQNLKTTISSIKI
ncbi:hypothetical protein M3Y97_00020700 [Aphelenchoides bicaudatus]|nr:hypothetical protein M3Y97_00020700 [Aphelenchoides bicaudatus]